MKIRSKGLMISLCAGLILAAAACSPGNQVNKAPDQTAENKTAATVSTESETKPELRTLNIWMSEDYNTYPVAKIIEEKTGYKVKYDMLPADKAIDKLNLLISSAEPYDVITLFGDKAAYTDYAQKGALMDLAPLIEEYGPNIKAAIAEDTFESVKVDGEIYAIPNRSVEFISTNLMIRKDWLDKVGLELPTTTDELTEILKAFKEKDPGGNGDKGAPMTISGDWPIIENITGAFGLANHWTEIDGKLVARPENPGFRGYLEYMSGLYRQGLLDKEFAVNKDATMKEKFTSGRVGIIPLGWWDIPTIGDALNKNFPEAEYVYLPALKGKDGHMGLGAAAGFDRISFIPKASKHPEDAMKWINAKLDKDLFKLISIGEEGKHYTVEEGKYKPILPAFTEERNMANNYLMGIDEKLYPEYWQARVRKDERLFERFNYLNKELPAEVKITDPVGLAPSLPVSAKTSGALSKMISDFTVKVTVGEEEVSALDDFIAKFNAAGGEESSREVNEWYASVKH